MHDLNYETIYMCMHEQQEMPINQKLDRVQTDGSHKAFSCGVHPLGGF